VDRGAGRRRHSSTASKKLLTEEDVDVRDILVVSYTRGRRRDPRTSRRAPRHLAAHAQGERLHDAREGLRTPQPLAGDVVGESDKEDFCDEFGIDYEDEYEGSRRRSARSTTIGNKIIATSQWLQRTDRDVADWYDVPFQWNDEEIRLPPDIDDNAQTGNKYTPTWPSDDDRIDVPEAIRGWRNYKRARTT